MASASKSKSKVIWIILAVALFVISFFVPTAEGLEVTGKQSFFLLAIGLILLLTNSIPVGIAGFMLIAFIPVMGVGTFSDALSIFSLSSSWFLMISFALSGIISQTSVPHRILAFMLKTFGKNTKLLVFGIMAGTAVISMFISNVPATAIPMSFAMILIDAMDEGEDKKRMAKALLIGIPFAAMMGGCGTPVGSTANVIAMDMLEMYAGMNVTFLQWVIIGLPIAIIGLVVCWVFVIAVYKPPEISQNIRSKFISDSGVSDKMNREDITLLVVMGAMMVLWVLGSWVKALNTTLVAIIGVCVMTLPKIGITTMDDVLRKTPWSAWLMAMGFGAVSTVINTSGAVGWIMSLITVPDNISVVILLVIVGIVIAILHLPIPTGPSLIRLAAPALIVLCASVGDGLNPAIMIMALCFFCAFNLVLPLDPVPIVTYSKGYYTFGDYAKAGIPATIVLTVLVAILIPVILPVLGFV